MLIKLREGWFKATGRAVQQPDLSEIRFGFRAEFHLYDFRVTQACGLFPVVCNTGRISPRPSCSGVNANRPISSTTNVVGSIGLPPTRASRTILEHL